MKRKGISLVEVIAAMIVLGVIAFLITNLLKYSFGTLNYGNKSSEMQMNVRAATESINSIIKNSTAIFLVPNSSFSKGVLSEGWDYIGTIEKKVDGKEVSQIVHYKYNEDSKTHDAKVLSQADVGTVYTLRFDKKDVFEKDKLVKFTIKGFEESDLTNPRMTLESEMEALNSLQVINYSSEFDYSSAIAFRSDERNMKKTIGQISLVLDCSGSMNFDMDSETITKGVEERRTYALRKAGQVLLTKLHEISDTSKLNLTPFASTAKIKYVPSFPESEKMNSKFMKLSEYYTEVFDLFDPANYIPVANMDAFNAYSGNIDDPLDPVGGTNIGDGLRLAYHAILEEDEKTRATGDIPTNYIILLIDGINKEYTYKDIAGDSTYFYFGKDSVESNPSLGTEYAYDGAYDIQELADLYLEQMAHRVRDASNIKVYFVVLSDVADTEVNKLKANLGVADEAIFKTSDTDELGRIFESIGRSIVSDLWFLNGPQI